MNNKIKYSLIIIIIICIICIQKSKSSKKYLFKLVNYEKNLKKSGISGIILFIIICILLNLVIFTIGLNNMITGYIFGFKNGIVIAYIINLITAIIGFIISRYFLKNNVNSLINKNKKFKKIYKNQINYKFIDWFKYNSILRISPIPFHVTSAFFGITNISFKKFILCSIFTILPACIIETYIGTNIKNLKNFKF